MNNRHNGAGIGGLVIVILGVIALVITRIFAMPIFRVLLWVVIAIVAIVIIGIILLVILSNKTSNKAAQAKKAASGKLDLSEEQTAVLRKGRNDLMEIRRVLVRLKNNTIRTKGNEICGVCDKILQTLKEKPNQITSVRQFLNYYLPTLDKILKKYQRLEAGNVPYADSAAKVEKYLGDVKTAMDKQYNNLFEGDKLDMTVDMEAMTIGLKRDGLLSDADFVRKEPEPETIPDISTPLLDEPPVNAPGIIIPELNKEPVPAETSSEPKSAVKELEFPYVVEPDIPDPDAPGAPELKLFEGTVEDTDKGGEE
ncbi:MAG: 5-bromo-4-chloroindolyl phosphate hydrolysis family protein [Lachnospiraceae bacterium]|nr:5-bromo-4-chloroindolyl phosphate hydrolysis family protein [Lachnospiraceae bacterium]